MLSLIGLADAGYLTITHFAPQVLECSTHGFVNCAAVTQSAQSRLLDIPVAFLGLAFYIAMTAINLPRMWRSTDRRIVWLRVAMVVSGMGMVLWLLSAELLILHHLCEFCTGVHIVTFLLFVLVMTSMPRMLLSTEQR
ncbi:MAG: vitamin K epoxide reductase family protein [Acidimicrobiales bacterium]